MCIQRHVLVVVKPFTSPKLCRNDAFPCITRNVPGEAPVLPDEAVEQSSSPHQRRKVHSGAVAAHCVPRAVPCTHMPPPPPCKPKV